MNKPVFALFGTLILTLSLSAPVLAAGFQNAPAGQQGGFSGPGQTVGTATAASQMRDDVKVRLRGNIINHLGGEKYTFQDSTGTIVVDIDHDKWGGQTITPTDTIEIYGEIDRDWNSVEVEVDRLIKIQ